MRAEYYKRGFFGWLIKLGFIAFNLFMAAWLFIYWAQVAKLGNADDSEAARVGMAIGASIGTGALLFLWVSGAIILGLLTYFTRGTKVILEAGDERGAWRGRVGIILTVLVTALTLAIAVTWLSVPTPPALNINSSVTATGTRVAANEAPAHQNTSPSAPIVASPSPASRAQHEIAIIEGAHGVEKALRNLQQVMEQAKTVPKASAQYFGAQQVFREIQPKFSSIADDLSEQKRLLNMIPQSSERYGEAHRLIYFFEVTETELRAAIAAIARGAACATTDITVKHPSWHRTLSDYADIVGELINNCDQPTGVQIQVTFRSRSGNVVTVEEFWPASTRNISAHASYPFSFTTTVSAKASTMGIQILDVKHW